MKKLSAFFIMLMLVLTAGVCVSAADFTVANPNLPAGQAYHQYNAQIEIQGGNDGYTFEYVSGMFPNNLTLHSDGSITGTPTSSGWFSSIGVRITNTADNTSAIRIFTLNIMPRLVKVKLIMPSNPSYDGVTEYSVTAEVYDTDGTTLLTDVEEPIIRYGSERLEGPIVDAGNYYVDVQVPGCMIIEYLSPQRLVIEPLPVAELSVRDKTVPYDGLPHGVTADDITINPAAAGYTVEYRKLGGSVITQQEPSAAGRYEVSVRTTNPNYAETTAYATLTITARPVDFTVTDTSKEFSGSDQYPTITPSVEGIGYTVEYIGANGRTNHPIDAGVYTIVITLDDDDAEEYAIRTITSTRFEITPQLIKFTADRTSFPYDGTEHEPQYTMTPDIGMHGITITYSKGEETDVKIKDVGTYDVHIDIGTDNFAVSPDSDLIITVEQPLETVNFTVDNSRKVYNKSEQAPDIEPSIAGFTEGTDYTVTYFDAGGTALEGKPINAGEYTYTIELVDTANYQMGTIVPMDRNMLIFEIQKQVVDFTNSNATKEYNGNPQGIDLQPSVDGFAEGTDYTVTYSPALGGTAITGKPVNAGAYGYTINITDTNNYELGTIGPADSTGDNHTFTITKKVINFTVSDNEVSYDGNAHKATVTSTDNTIPSSVYEVKYSRGNTNTADLDEVINVGLYRIVIEIKDTNNYELDSSFSATMTVNPFMNYGNSPAAMIYKDAAHTGDAEWQQAALEELTTNLKFSAHVPDRCSADVVYNGGILDSAGGAHSPDFYPETVIVRNLSDFTDPGLLVDGNVTQITATDLQPLDDENGIYYFDYHYSDESGLTKNLVRYVMVINKTGDTNGDGNINAIDANFLARKLSTTSAVPTNIKALREGDINMDGMVTDLDPAAIRNRFSKKIIEYYPWL